LLRRNDLAALSLQGDGEEARPSRGTRRNEARVLRRGEPAYIELVRERVGVQTEVAQLHETLAQQLVDSPADTEALQDTGYPPS